MEVRSAKESRNRRVGLQVKSVVLLCGSLQDTPFYEVSWCNEWVLGPTTLQRDSNIREWHIRLSDFEIVSNPERVILAQYNVLTCFRRSLSVVDEYSKQWAERTKKVRVKIIESNDRLED